MLHGLCLEVLFQFFTGEVHVLGQVVAEAFLRLREEVLFEHQKVGILAGCDGTLGGLHAQLPGTVDGVAQEHLLYAHLLVLRREYGCAPGEFV